METRTTDVAGLLLVDKPAGITSHDVVAIVRRVVRSRRVGHAGTLDPFATGLLVVLAGRGTRLIPYVAGDPKVYEAVIRFGAETDTDDLTGTVTREAAPPNDAAIDAAIRQLTGPLDQIPPAYSAKKVEGTRAYAAARRGAPLELEPVRVVVHSWEILSRDGDDVHVRVTCDGGTYIRALARDAGRLTGSAAHLAALRRTRSGAFSVEQAATVDQLRAGIVPLQPLLAAIPELPARRLDAAEYQHVVHGRSVPAQTDAPRVALVDDEETLIAVAERNGVALNPTLVLRDA